MSATSVVKLPLKLALEIVATYRNLKTVSNFKEMVLFEHEKISERIVLLREYIDKSEIQLTVLEKSFVYRTLLFLFLRREQMVSESLITLKSLLDEFETARFNRSMK